jgi:mannan endo-1,4-beta-mannosidase
MTMKNSKSKKRYILAAFFVILNLHGIAQTAFKSLNYIYSISGKSTVAGIHNREPNSNPHLWTDSISVLSGKTPGLWSGDFLFLTEDVNARWNMTHEAEKAWKKGSLVNMMWHTCSPAYTEPCAWNDSGVLDQLSDPEWTSLITDGDTLNLVWKSRLDIIAVYLQYLKDKKVEVLFRPFHEMNQPVFWWAGRKGSNGTAKLFQITHDYLTHNKGLTNLIWVWDVQDFNTLSTDLVDYNPGNEYWDVLALDMYSSDGADYTTDKYNACLKAAKGKPIAIGECQKLPTSAELKAQPKWTFFMSWAELTIKHNAIAQIQELYGAENIVTLDEMPGWQLDLKK